MTKAKYIVRIGIDYGKNRAEPGDVVDDLPADDIKWLTREGAIERLADGKKTTGDETAQDAEEAVATGFLEEEEDTGGIVDTEALKAVDEAEEN